MNITSLPPSVKETLISDDIANAYEALRERFTLSEAQFGHITDLVDEMVLKNRGALDMPRHLAKIPDADSLDLRALALQLAIDILWPIEEYLGNVDTLITRLGGRVPQKKRLLQRPEARAVSREDWTYGAAPDVLERRKEYNDFYLTQKPMRDRNGRLKAPSASNWLSDYHHVMGAEGSSSLKRSQYIAKSASAQKLNDAEKKNLLNFLVSYEERRPMYWRSAEEQYLLVEEQLPQAMQRQIMESTEGTSLADLVKYYQNIQGSYAQSLTDMKRGLDLEINGNAKKLADILWDAMGLQEAERGLGAIDLMIDRHMFFDVLTQDQRFKGIVGRFVDVQYGTEAKTFWTGDISKGVGLMLLWKIILKEKLGIDEQKAAVMADYFSRRLELSGSPMYLDRTSGKFLFREIAYKDRQFTLVA